MLSRVVSSVKATVTNQKAAVEKLPPIESQGFSHCHMGPCRKKYSLKETVTNMKGCVENCPLRRVPGMPTLSV